MSKSVKCISVPLNVPIGFTILTNILEYLTILCTTLQWNDWIDKPNASREKTCNWTRLKHWVYRWVTSHAPASAPSV